MLYKLKKKTLDFVINTLNGEKKCLDSRGKPDPYELKKLRCTLEEVLPYGVANAIVCFRRIIA
jgi:hypothetical protein